MRSQSTTADERSWHRAPVWIGESVTGSFPTRLLLHFAVVWHFSVQVFAARDLRSPFLFLRSNISAGATYRFPLLDGTFAHVSILHWYHD